jgi:predicted  nucleic acid-binding Zn-ribbon protein
VAVQKIEALFRLQTLDLEIEDKTKRLHEVEARLGESAEYVAAREALAAAAKSAHDAEAALREREFDLARVEGKLKEVTAILYSGKPRPAKELASFQKEAELLTQQKSKAEDAELEAMDRLESLQGEHARTKTAFAAAEVTWREEQAALSQQQSDLQAELDRLRGARETMLPNADPAHLPVYDSLRRQKGGRAVAKVEQSVCLGCRVAMAVSQVQRARTNPGLTFCSSCGRILYVAR